MNISEGFLNRAYMNGEKSSAIESLKTCSAMLTLAEGDKNRVEYLFSAHPVLIKVSAELLHDMRSKDTLSDVKETLSGKGLATQILCRELKSRLKAMAEGLEQGRQAGYRQDAPQQLCGRQV